MLGKCALEFRRRGPHIETRTKHLLSLFRCIWKHQKVYNDGIYLVYTRHMTIYSILVYLEYTWYIPVTVI